MALRFLYLFFIRVTQLVRLWWRGHDELAIEVVMLRHEVSVLRRQVTPPSTPTGRPGAAHRTGDCPRQRLGRFSSSPTPCSAGTESSSAAAGFGMTVTLGNHSLRIDEQKKNLGTAQGPNPTRVQLAALASCMAQTFVYCCARGGDTFDRLSVDVQADLDFRGALGVRGYR